MTHVRLAALAALLILFDTAGAAAQVFGTLSWQMQPFCNTVTLTLSVLPSGFTLHGFDDRCGAGMRAGAVGAATFNPDGTVGLHFTLAASPAASAVQVTTVVNPATGQGTWADSEGNGGAFVLSGATGGLPPRPSPPGAIAARDVAENPRAGFDPCATGAGQPATLVLCGTINGQWNNGGFGLPGLQVWRDAEGTVHVRGSARHSVLINTSSTIFVLPAELRPRRTLAFGVSTGLSAGAHQGGTALLVIYGDDLPTAAGSVSLFSATNPAHNTIHVGELTFRADR